MPASPAMPRPKVGSRNSGLRSSWILPLLSGTIDRRGAVHLLARHVVVRVAHAERLEDPLPQEIVDRHARDLLDEDGDVIGRVAVHPPIARMEGERVRCGAFDHFGQGRGPCRRERDRRRPPFDDARRAREREAEARGVGQDVADGHRPRGRHQQPVVEHHLVRVRRQPLRDRVVEHELAVFPQHHQRRRHDRLGHRHQGEDRVAHHRQVLFLVAPALRLVMHDLALAADERHRAGNLIRVDVVLDERFDALEALGRHADGFRLRHRQVGLGDAAVSRQEQGDEGKQRRSAPSVAELHVRSLQTRQW